MGQSRNDYLGYRTIWLLKSDLKPKELKKFGIITTKKEIVAKSQKAIKGYILTGGHGHQKRCAIYSINQLREILRGRSS